MKPSLSRIRSDPSPGWETLASGIRVRRMVEADGSSIILYRLDPGRRFARHEHPFHELGVVLAGQGRLLIAEEGRRVGEGDSFYIPGGTPHGFEVDADNPVVLMNVTVPLPSDHLKGPLASEVLDVARKVAGRASVPGD